MNKPLSVSDLENIGMKNFPVFDARAKRWEIFSFVSRKRGAIFFNYGMSALSISTYEENGPYFYLENPFQKSVHVNRDLVFPCDPITHKTQIQSMKVEELARRNVYIAIKVSEETGKFIGPAFWCSDGYSSENFQEALDHEIEWLNSPVEGGEDEKSD